MGEIIEPPKEISLADIRGKLLGKLIKTKVMVSKVGEINKECYGSTWECPKCGKVCEESLFIKDKFCRHGQSRIKMENVGDLTRDFKEIEVEEMLDTLSSERQPERKRAKIVGNLLEKKKIINLSPGTIVEITGYVVEERTKAKMDRLIFNYSILVETLNIKDIDEDDEILSEEDISKIKEMSKDNILEKLRDSLAPNIYDFENIKTSLLLQMVRGSNKLTNSRSRIHILLCGDPSTCKSKLAEAVHLKSPRSVYGSGEGMSKTGLTSVLEKDELSGRWGVRAGSICRANKSLMIIDEMDKLNEDDKNALNRPMESGIVTVDKVGIHADLPADTCVLGCCNPKKGTFNISHLDSIQSQLNLPAPLMTRFDLIYIIKDEVNLERDTKIWESMFSENEAKGPISTKMFKKYIKYASKIEPTITPEAKKYSIDLCNKLRQAHIKRQETEKKESPFSFRQGGGIVRLAYASAKLRLSDKVEVCDFELAEKLTMDALKSLGFGNGLNGIEYNALYGGTTAKKQSLIDSVKSLVKNEISQNNRDEDEIKKKILSVGIPEKEFDKIWNQFRKEGTIIGSRTNISYME